MIQRTLILATALVIGSAPALATSLMPQLPNAKKANLETVELDPRLEDKATSGYLEVNDREVLLYVYRAFECRTGQICPMVMPAPQMYRAKIVERTTSCGSKIVTARHDMRPVDGNLLEITVADHSTRLCRDLRRGKVEVELAETTARGGIRYVSNLYSAAGFEKDGEQSQVVTIDSIELDNTNRDRVFGRAFRADSADIVRKDDRLTLTIRPHTIYCMAVVGANCPNPMPHHAELKIVEQKPAGCGSTLIRAMGRVRTASGQLKSATLDIVDHSTRICDDYRKYQTEATYTIELGRRDSVNELRAHESLLLQ